MLPDHPAREPVEDLAADVHRVGKEERRQQHAAEDRHGGEQLPQPQRDDRDHKLTEEKGQAGHGDNPSSGRPGLAPGPTPRDLSIRRSLWRRRVAGTTKNADNIITQPPLGPARSARSPSSPRPSA